jgi:hypothetical protein
LCQQLADPGGVFETVAAVTSGHHHPGLAGQPAGEELPVR